MISNCSNRLLVEIPPWNLGDAVVTDKTLLLQTGSFCCLLDDVGCRFHLPIHRIIKQLQHQRSSLSPPLKYQESPSAAQTVYRKRGQRSQVYLCVWMFISSFIDNWKHSCLSEAQCCHLLIHWELQPNEDAEELAPTHNHCSSCYHYTARVTSRMLYCSSETGRWLRYIIITTSYILLSLEVEMAPDDSEISYKLKEPIRLVDIYFDLSFFLLKF